MHLGRVLGTLWSTRRHPSTEGLRWLIIQPEDELERPCGSPLVAADSHESSAGPGERVFYVTAREAVLAMGLQEAPIDAAIMGIVEGIESERER